MPHPLALYQEGPVVNWDFLQSQSLTSFSRTSNATLFDSTGKLTYAANNLILRSNAWDATGSVWTSRASIASTLNDAGTLAPDGTQTATLLRTTSSNGYLQQNGATSSIGKKISSFWVKRKTGTGNIDAVDAQANVWTPITVTSEWTRVSLVAASSSATENWIGIRLQTSGDEVWVWGGQVELVTYQTTPSTYNPTTTAPYYGPRYPYAYNGTTWDAQGLLVEAAGTNLCTYSEAFGSWLDNNLTVATGQSDPSGATNGCLIYPTVTASAVERYKNFNYTSGQRYTLSLFAKASGKSWIGVGTNNSANRQVYFNASTGAKGTEGSGYSGSVVNCGNGWYRFSVTFTGGTNTDNYIDVFVCDADGSPSITKSGTNGAVVFGAQLEAGDLSSYIPNLATGTTTRNADTSLAFSAISLPTGLSFSRASNAMQYDAAGRLTYAPNNLLTYSNDFRTTAAAGSTRPWIWDTVGGATPVVTINAGTAPDGTLTANRVILNKGAGAYSRIWQDAAAIYGTVYLFSVYMKTYSGGTSNVGLRLDGTAINCVVTGTWQRFSLYVASSSASAAAQILLYSNIPENDNTADLLVWGAQVEPVTYQTAPSAYNATTTSAYYGPRYDYDPLTRLPKGLLIEEGRTNYLQQSQTLNTTWANSGTASIASASITQPNGVVGGWKQTATGSPAAQIYQDLTTYSIPTGALTNMFIVKAGTANWVSLAVFDGGTRKENYFDIAAGAPGTMSAGCTPTIKNLGNGWYQISVSLTVAAKPSYIAISPVDADNNMAVTVGKYFYIFGAQLEAGSFPTSYIPTTSASVARSADIANVTGANFSSYWNASAGTMVGEFAYFGAKDPVNSYARAIFEASDGSASNRYDLRSNSSGYTSITSYSSTAGNFSTSGGSASGVPMRNALAYAAANWAASVNGGVAVAPTTPGASVPSVNRLTFGDVGSSANAWVRKFAYYNVRLADAKLQTKSVVGATL